MMIDYENLEIKRDRPDYPIGLKHYSKETEFENVIFDLDLILYRMKCLLWGGKNEETDIQNGTGDEEETEEILRGLC